LVESNITVRGKRSLRFIEVRQKMRIKLSLPEESKVTRDLKEIRKNAHILSTCILVILLCGYFV
jgi:hypothetical protein